MRVARVALLLLLAGLAGLPATAQEQGPAAAHPHLVTYEWAGGSTIFRNGTCAAGCLERFPSLREFPVAANERVVSFVARLTANPEGAPLAGGLVEPDAGKPAVVRAACLGAGGVACPPGSAAEATSTLPAEVSADGLEWPLGAGLSLDAWREEPNVAGWNGFAEEVDYVATVTVLVDPSVKLPPTAEARQPFDIHTTTGQCLPFVEAYCAGGPAQVLYLGNVSGSLTRLHGNLTWDAVSPTAQTLRLDIRCFTTQHDRQPCNGGAGFPLVYDGPSPLVFDSGDISWQHVAPGAWFEVAVEESSLEPTRHVEGFTRQPFHLQLEFVSAVELDG